MRKKKNKYNFLINFTDFHNIIQFHQINTLYAE